MTTRVGFYHLQTTPLERALPKLLEKAYAAGHRVVVMAGSEERVAHLDSLLWTYDADSWLPHGKTADGDAALQPIALTAADDNPNAADVLVLTDGIVSARMTAFARCLTLFDGHDENAVVAARRLWRELAAAGLDLRYYQQTESGGWEEKSQHQAAKGGVQGETEC
jgi:DNA polymerase-3 subunit chi